MSSNDGTAWDDALKTLRNLADGPKKSAPPPRVVEELQGLVQRLSRRSSIEGRPDLKRAASMDAARMGGMPMVQSASKKMKPADDPAKALRLHVKKATVRIGLYDRRDGVFFGLGTGAIVSECGHVLSAAHIFVGPAGKVGSNPEPFSQMFPDHVGLPRFRGRNESADLVICIGVYEDETLPCKWEYSATLLTPPELLKKKQETGYTQKGVPWEKLLDLAVLQLTGTLAMDPPVYKPSSAELSCTLLLSTSPLDQLPLPYLYSQSVAHRRLVQYRLAFSADFNDQYTIVSEAPFSCDKAWELPAVLQLGNPDAIGLGQERLAVAGWPSVRGEHALHMDNGTLLSKPKDSHCKQAAR